MSSSYPNQIYEHESSKYQNKEQNIDLYEWFIRFPYDLFETEWKIRIVY